MRMPVTRGFRHKFVAAAASASLLGVAACGGGSGDGDTAAGAGGEGGGSGETIVMTVDPSAVPVFVAQDMGLFEEHGVDVEIENVGQADAGSLLLTGETDIAWMGPMDAAEFASQGEPFIYYSTAGAVNMWNGVVVRAEDAETYEDLSDLEGKKLGIPGVGTGTWKTFTVFASHFYGIEDPETAFNPVTADSGALLALLQQGEVDAALLFSAQSVAGLYSPEFHSVFNFTTVMQEELGVPLPITGQVATKEWYESHEEDVEKIDAALDEATKWMVDNAQEFDTDGRYASLAADNGWHTSDATREGIIDLLSNGEYEMLSDVYTSEFRDALYELVEAGEGVLVESVPPIDSFLAPGA